MSILPSFDPPAFLRDLSDPSKREWHVQMSDWIDSEIRPTQGVRFYNATRTDTIADQQRLDILWTAFPRQVKISSPNDRIRWRRADQSRNRQDEYCEWSVTRDGAGKIVKVAFTCEGPEYWDFLSKHHPDRVLELYREHISPSVQHADLFDGGDYRPINIWNSNSTSGAMHLIQPANTLRAEINIAARSTIVRFVNGRLLTGERELIDCGRYGSPERFSDPHIGGEVNKLARLDADITIDNPVAIYIHQLNTTGWVTPDGTDPSTFWQITRGDAAHCVRAEYAVPAARGYSVSDIKINGDSIEFGAQIADFISMRVRGLACRFGQSSVPRITTCATNFGFAANAGIDLETGFATQR
jgi:hypothetical protein